MIRYRATICEEVHRGRVFFLERGEADLVGGEFDLVGVEMAYWGLNGLGGVKPIGWWGYPIARSGSFTRFGGR